MISLTILGGLGPATAQQQASGPSRRQVLKAAVWAAPAVVSAVSSPTFAASLAVPDPRILTISPYRYSWGGYDANSHTPGTVQTQTTFQVSFGGQGTPPAGNATITFRIWFQNSAGTEFGHADYLVVLPQGYSGESQRNTEEFAGLRGGTYTVFWEVIQAQDASGAAIGPAPWSSQRVSKTLEVKVP